MNRRKFLVAAAAGVAASVARAAGAKPAVPIIDTHVHLFDPRRPQGVPYAGPRGQPAPASAVGGLCGTAPPAGPPSLTR